MPAGEQTDQQSIDDILLTDDDLPEFGFQAFVSFAEFLDLLYVIGRELLCNLFIHVNWPDELSGPDVNIE